MKRILFFLLFGLLLSSCIREDRDDCPADLRLVFTFNSNPTRFDDRIRNDILLHVYNEDLYYTELVIPYSEISGGREYRVKKTLTGNIGLVAWSVPSSDNDTGRIPACREGERMSEKCIRMELNDDMSCQSMGGLFVGPHNYYDGDLRSENLQVIELQDAVCRVTVSILGFEDPAASRGTVPDAVEISGFKRGMTISGDPEGDDGTVSSELDYFAEDRAFKTGTIGLMPSGEDQFLQVTVSGDGGPLLRVSTDQRSVPGYNIDLVITKNFGVELYVNGWRNKNATIEWM